MDLRWTPTERAFRAEAREWLAANVPADPLPSGDTRAGFAAHLAWERRMHADRWSVVSWPERYGGRDASVLEWLIFEEEYHRAGAPARVTQNGIFLLAPALLAFGTDAQRDTLLPRMAAAEDTWCQGWSEPGAGSDLAALTSRAARVDGGWRLTGQKTWSTRGAFCTHLFGLFRSDPSARRHAGLTYFLVPLDLDGVTVRGFGRLDGDEGFAEVFLDDVFVPDGAVLGDVGQGWQVAMATTGSERGLTLRSPGRYLETARRLRDLARSCPERLDGRLADDVVEVWTRAEAYRLFTLAQASGPGGPAAESSLTKIWWSELDVLAQRTALALRGPDAALDDAWTRAFQFALAGPIYAGTNEIQRTIVAERLLGLPRPRR